MLLATGRLGQIFCGKSIPLRAHGMSILCAMRVETSMITVKLRDDSRQFESGITIAEVAKSIGMGLYKAACAGRVNGNAVDLRTPLTEDCELEILTFDSAEGKHAYWHTTSHILAQAVRRLFPEAA